MTGTSWEEIEHTADWGLRVWGPDMRALFEHAALGMMSLLDGRAQEGADIVAFTLDLEGPDLETLLVDWLTELLYIIEVEQALFPTIRVDSVENLRLQAHVEKQAGEGFKKHIKAVTFHNLRIVQKREGYETVLIFDV